jgi:hypothetical protein
MREQGIPGQFVLGQCICDNFLINAIADEITEALPIIAEVSTRAHYKGVFDAVSDYISDWMLYRHVGPQVRT